MEGITMSVITLLIAVGIAVLAMFIRAAILQNWTPQHLAADFFFAFALLLLPGFIHA